MALYRRGLDLTQLITHRYSLEDAPEAYERFAAGRSGKVVLCQTEAA
jgi:threonine dehydrogenase-like Zn-dependent dehydrogenase